MAEPTTTPMPEGLEKLLANPDLLRTIGTIMGAPTPEKGQGAPDVDGLSRVLSDPEMMAKLPQIMEMLKPMMQSTSTQESVPTAAQESVPAAAHPVVAPPHNCRDDLLLALKPFLSPERASAIDMLLRLGRLGSVLQTLK